MKEELTKEGIIKEEKVGQLMSKLNLIPGTLYLTHHRLVLNAHKTGTSGLGILGVIIKKQVENKKFGFNLEFKDIKRIAQSKYGLQKNIMEITDTDNKTYRIFVKNYQVWESEFETILLYSKNQKAVL